MTLHGCVETRRVVDRGPVGATGEGLGGEARERRRVAVLVGHDRRREVAVDGEIRIGLREHARQAAVIEAHAHDVARRVARPGLERMRAQSPCQGAHARHRIGRRHGQVGDRRQVSCSAKRRMASASRAQTGINLGNVNSGRGTA